MTCLSVILMAALTIGIVLSDLAYMRQDRVITHFILGGIVTALFHALCERGYEMVNWGILLVIPLYMLLSIVSIPVNQECSVCNKPVRQCECSQMPRNQKTECYQPRCRSECPKPRCGA